MSIFKKGDSLYHIEHGWGQVTEIDDYNLLVIFEKASNYTCSVSNNILSFREYTLQGFSQERPIELPNFGEMCLVRDSDDEIWNVRKFVDFEKGYYICEDPLFDGNRIKWKQMKRIKILD